MAAQNKEKDPKLGQSVQEAMEILRQVDDKDASLMDVMQFAEVMADSMHTFFGSLDQTLYREFREISTYIADMRSDIGSLQANDLRNSHIPSAGHELDAVVESTETATNTIMECAEDIMAADTSDHDAYVASVNDSVMKIFEACSFQDITGQRISKVVQTLQHIEERVSIFAQAIGNQDDPTALSDEESQREKRNKDLILNGPQDKGVAIEQDEIDKMLSGSGGAQSDIDALFD